MRVTPEQKELTRKRIVDEALGLFATRGFAETTTRDIARAAGIATGTMFNYFDSKEALAMSVFLGSYQAGVGDWQSHQRGDESLDEALFAQIAATLRHLEPYRSFIGEVFERTMTPFAVPGVCREADEVRRAHLEAVWHLITNHVGLESQAEFEILTSHLYWSLYLGVVAFWSRDDSPHQEDTLALIDRSTRLFVHSLGHDQNLIEDNTGPIRSPAGTDM